MLELKLTSEFRSDRKKMKKRGADLSLLTEAIQKLQNQDDLPVAYQDHPLHGFRPPRRDLHVTPDWVLIYRIDKSKNQLILYRTGTHSDLFK